jgi:hypothetical protein
VASVLSNAHSNPPMTSTRQHYSNPSGDALCSEVYTNHQHRTTTIPQTTSSILAIHP